MSKLEDVDAEELTVGRIGLHEAAVDPEIFDRRVLGKVTQLLTKYGWSLGRCVVRDYAGTRSVTIVAEKARPRPT